MSRRRSYSAAEGHGRRAELLCAWTLRLKGYRVLARQWRCASGELDIVARRGRTVAIIEVKARAAADGAVAAIGRQQRRRIGRAAAQFLAAYPALSHCTLRYDAMLVVPWRLPIHLKAAWVEGD